MTKEAIDWYIESRPIYKRLSSKVESLLSEVFESNNISYHIVTSRTKTIESVRGKVSKGKYERPEEEIQDFSGIRIITYVEDEVSKICDVIESIFEIDKENSSNKSDDLGLDKVGYKSVHYIASLDANRLNLPEYKQYIGRCFEIQVRTILQHAWAEIEHDRNYKYAGKLPKDIGRRFKILSGVLEMADREFNNISNEIDTISKNTAESTKTGKLDIALSSTTLKQYLHTKFKNLIDQGYVFDPDTENEVISSMEKFGINTLEEFDQIIPEDFEAAISRIGSKRLPISGFIIRILIINDYDKYFSQLPGKEHWVWTGLDDDGIERNFFSHFGVDWKAIEEKYDVIFCI